MTEGPEEEPQSPAPRPGRGDVKEREDGQHDDGRAPAARDPSAGIDHLGRMGEGLDGMEGKQGQPGPGHHPADPRGPAYADQAISESSRAGDASRGLEQIT